MRGRGRRPDSTRDLADDHQLIQPGGRIDTWYLRHHLAVTDIRTGDQVLARMLTGYTATLNDAVMPLDVPAAIAAIEGAHATLHPEERWGPLPSPRAMRPSPTSPPAPRGPAGSIT
ncbi:hypothetical protein [Streptomyces achromogenes]|uniref:hypothetical protein n=1 Tax=Streptomyces achromogenes TaxID=67255 RepID=UPI0033DC568B